MKKILEYFNPLTIIEKLITIGITLAIAAALVWWFNSKIRDHYQAPLIAEYKAASDAAEKLRAERESVNEKKLKGAINAKVQTLEKNLAAANRTAASAIGLRDAIRASEDRAKTDLAACVQHSRTLGELLSSGAELAGRIAKEADGHVADKEALTASWPK